MSAISFELEAERRQNMGRGASRRLRQDNRVPAIMYGGNETPVALMLDHNKVATALSHEAFYSHILTLKVDGKGEKVILKAVQRHPSRPRITHMDFQRIRADQKLHMRIPLHFEGEEKSPGVKEGGVVLHGMNDVEVTCLPAHLPEFIAVDISALKLNEGIHLSDLKLPKNVELTAFAHGVEGHDLSVVSIHIPRVVEEEVLEMTPVEEGAADEAASNADEVAGGTEEKEKGKGK